MLKRVAMAMAVALAGAAAASAQTPSGTGQTPPQPTTGPEVSWEWVTGFSAENCLRIDTEMASRSGTSTPPNAIGGPHLSGQGKVGMCWSQE